QALAYLRQALCSLALLGQRSATEDRSPGHPVRKPLLSGESDGRLSLLLGCVPFGEEVMEPSRQGKSNNQSEGMRQLLGQGEGLMAPLPGLGRIAQQPQRKGEPGENLYAKDSACASTPRA